MKSFSTLALLASLPVLAFGDYLISDFENGPGIWSAGSTSDLYTTGGSHSLRLTLPAADMWYHSGTIIEVAQLDSATRQAAFTNATKLIIDFTYTNYPADWYADHDVGFILQGSGAGQDWMELTTKKMTAFGETTTAEIPITPAQATMLASDPGAKIFLFAHFGNGNNKSATLFLDSFRTDAAGGTATLPLSLEAARIDTATRLAIETDFPVDVSASSGATITLQSATDPAYTSAQALTLAGASDLPKILYLTLPSPLEGNHTYTVSVAGLQGQGRAQASAQQQTVALEGRNLSVNSLDATHRISPYIYGLSYFGDSPDYLREGGFTVNRWGGNAVSKFNWTKNATNRAADWYFLNSAIDNDPLTRVATNAANGAITEWTLASLPWVAKDQNSYSFSVAKYGEQEKVSPHNSDMGNGVRTNGTRIQNTFTDALQPNRARPSAGDPADAVYQDAFIQYFDDAVGGFTRKIPFVAIDNEMDIWDGTHADAVHDKMSYAVMRDTFTTYARMVREELPDAQIFGPVSTGWYFYWNSSKGGERSTYGMNFLPWFLQSIQALDTAYGQRTLDVLDLHYYPEACLVNTEKTQEEMDAWRMRATREWWDSSYRAEGSFGKDAFWATGEPNQYYPAVIPRMRALIDQYYPGTKLGFSEWFWGNGFSNALATADTLGIFGQQDLYFSTTWQSPATNEPAFQAYRLFRNPEGQGGAFGSLALPVTSPNVDEMPIFASLGSKGDRLHVVLINKDRTKSRRSVVQLPAVTPDGAPTVYRFDSWFDDRVTRLPDGSAQLNGSTLSLVLPPYAAVHVVLPIVPTDTDADGMADTWEQFYAQAVGPVPGLNPLVADAIADNDGDGFSNRQEFLAGTHPLDPQSHPANEITSLGNGSYRITAFAPYDRTIRLQQSSDLQTWETIETFAGTDGWLEKVHTPGGPGEVYFRLQIE